MKSAAAYTSGGPRLTENQLGDGTEDLVVDHGLIVERSELPIGALVPSQSRADNRVCRNAQCPWQAERKGGDVGDR